MHYFIIVLTLVSITINVLLSKKYIAIKENSELEHKVLDEIGSIAFSEQIEEALKDIQKIMKEEYNYKYCSIYLKLENEKKYIVTNVEECYKTELEKYIKNVNENKIEESNIDAKVLFSKDGYLNYETAANRFLYYSAYIPLVDRKENIYGGILIEDDSLKNMTMIEDEFFSFVIQNLSIVVINLINEIK